MKIEEEGGHLAFSDFKEVNSIISTVQAITPSTNNKMTI